MSLTFRFFFFSKRFIIYQFMLTHMSDEDRFNLTGKLCQEVCSAQNIFQSEFDWFSVINRSLLMI